MAKQDGYLSITPLTGDDTILYEDDAYGTRKLAIRPDDYDSSHDCDRRECNDASLRKPLHQDRRTRL